MDADELRELMEEPPGGVNHGRVKRNGRWVSLEPDYSQGLPYVIDDPEYRHTKTYGHGTLAKYTHGRCRCDLCRAAMRDWKRTRRSVG